MKPLKTLLALSLALGLGLSPALEAGSLGKVIARSAIKKILRRDLARDAATVAKPLAKPRTVYRYTSGTRAAREAQQGLAPDSHMTSVARPGRPLSAEAAQRRYGLPSKPEVRETLRLEGQPVRHNKVLGGERGYGEITSPEKIPSESIRRIVPLQ
jgi:hypothetical protein